VTVSSIIMIAVMVDTIIIIITRVIAAVTVKDQQWLSVTYGNCRYYHKN